MKLEFLIEGKAPSPHLGIVNGYIQEGINQVSLIELVTVSRDEFSEDDLEQMVGKPATLKLKEVVDGEYMTSRFDGIIYEFHEMDPYAVESGSYIYRIIIRPKVWGMHIGNNARSFRDKTRIEVIKEVLEGFGLAKGVEFESKYFKEDAYLKLDQILQCEISDWAFVLQMLQETGINYCFIAPKDDSSNEMLYLINNEALFPKGFTSVIPWNPSREMTDGRAILSFETHARTVPKKVDITA
ncbi:MAG: phage late control D family protein, partial [Deltaproteobacteria bacterium]|nr:phage late control D family protein [Deltaproteobacteria bacterium]